MCSLSRIQFGFQTSDKIIDQTRANDIEGKRGKNILLSNQSNTGIAENVFYSTILFT